MKNLTGHTSAETAFIIADYPHGFTARCKKRMWIEHSPKHGERIVSQTTKPYLTHDVWQTPKKSTYDLMKFLVVEEITGHIKSDAFSMYDAARFEAFLAKGYTLTERQTKLVERIKQLFANKAQAQEASATV